ncbi:hypothetical protein BANRA_03513 [Klebsiella pneumoniae]|uniref:reverse transcriptase domain-containing protein n=1 Tax=Klebsiella pneumoniae TaxID=573 RepID=UPI000F230BF5|nr:hypothetical protein BANRA_03513 [Klebsiella pneumoniae]
MERRSRVWGTRNSHTCAGHRAGKACHRGCHAREAGEAAEERTVYSIVPPADSRALEATSLPEQESGRRSGWHQVDGPRRKHEEQHNRSAPEAASGQLQGAARQASLHPKADGKTTPARHRSLEDKIVQYALVKILNAVYENDFRVLIRFRPGRSQHDALDALATGLVRTNVNWVLDAGISQFFDRVSHEWLIRFWRASDRRPEGNQAHT